MASLEIDTKPLVFVLVAYQIGRQSTIRINKYRDCTAIEDILMIIEDTCDPTNAAEDDDGCQPC